MATLRITNLTTSDYWLNDIYTAVPASTAAVPYVDVVRSPAEISSMDGLQDAVAAGTLSAAVTYSADELAAIDSANQPLASLLVDGAVTDSAIAPVAASAIAAAPVTFYKAFAAAAAGTPDDVTVYAVNTLPYAIRITGASASVATAIGGSTLAIRSAAGGAGTLAATISSAAAGLIPAVSLGAGNASVVLTPGALVGLFIRRSDRGVAGEVFIQARREA